MSRILIFGDSQAGMPGAAAKRALEARGHTVTQVHNDGQGPQAQAREGSPYWTQYKQLARDADLVLLIFGRNNLAGTATRNALIRMRDGVRAPVMMSGPPFYPSQSDQTLGAALTAQNAAIFGHRYIPAYPHTPPSLPRAGVHFTASGAEPWGNAMAAAVDAALAPGGAATRPFLGSVDVLTVAAGVVGVGAVGALAYALMRRR